MANLWIILLWRNAMADEGTYIASSSYQLMSTYPHYIAHERSDEHVI
jgi:hypothetical protein